MKCNYGWSESTKCCTLNLTPFVLQNLCILLYKLWVDLLWGFRQTEDGILDYGP